MDKKIFYIMAPGKSINNVTDEEWDFLKKENTISFSHFVFSNKPTNYHFSYESLLTDKVHLDQLKKNGFIDINLLLGIQETRNYAKAKGFKNITNIIKGPAMPFNGNPWRLDEAKPRVRFKRCRAYDFNRPLFRYRGSLSSVLNATLILGADEIRLVGVDLNSQYYFFDGNEDKWANDDIDKERMAFIINNQKNLIRRRFDSKTMVKEYNPKVTNDTDELYNFHGIEIRGISDTVQWIDEELRAEGHNGIYITNKESKLYNRLQYKNIMDD